MPKTARKTDLPKKPDPGGLFYLKWSQTRTGPTVINVYMYDGVGYPQKGLTFNQWRQRCIEAGIACGRFFQGAATREEYFAE